MIRIVLALLQLAVAAAAAGPSPAIRWKAEAATPASAYVEVTGLPLAAQRSAPEDWFNVHVLPEGTVDPNGLPALAGRYEVIEGTLRFTPAFPLSPGVRYQAVLHPDRCPELAHFGNRLLVAEYRSPLTRARAAASVTRIEPTASVLPENLLKFYLHFSKPMSRGRIYDYIHLRDADGKEVELPFLEINEELWNPDMTRLTLFLDPGRIKRGVKPLEEIGPSLEQGKRYSLVIDSGWQDGEGRPLRRGFVKRFRVAAADRDPPDPERWRIASPRGRTRTPVRLHLGEPLDAALTLRLFVVIDPEGRQVAGKPSLHQEEREWRFAPDQSWTPGRYQIVIPSTIEDLAGNNIGKPFDVDLQAPFNANAGRTSVSLPFAVE